MKGEINNLINADNECTACNHEEDVDVMEKTAKKCSFWKPHSFKACDNLNNRMCSSEEAKQHYKSLHPYIAIRKKD